LLSRWLPGGRVEGAEYLALNPRRSDQRLGSFRVNTRTGRWADFAVEGACGGDVVSLAAYLGGIGQVEAAERLGTMLGIEARDAR
jgi:putative DNA primase/helicase